MSTTEGIRQTEQQGLEFVEIDLETHPYVTLFLDGHPTVVVRNNPNELAINVIDWPNALVSLRRNNRVIT